MRIFFIMMLVLLVCSGFRKTGKEPPVVYRSSIDTISLSGDTAFVRMSYFYNDTLQEEKTAILVPDTIVWKDFGLFGLPFKWAVRRIVRGAPLHIIPRPYRYAVIRVVRHGKSTDYRYRCIEVNHYHFDQLLKTDYLGRDGTLLKDGCPGGLRIECGRVTGSYLYPFTRLGRHSSRHPSPPSP